MKLELKKVIAYIIDLLILSILLSIYSLGYKAFTLEKNVIYANFMVLCALICVVILLVYIPTKTNGQTIGQRLMKLRVVNNDGSKRTYFQSFLRECLIKFAFITFFIPVVIISEIISFYHYGYFKGLHDVVLKSSIQMEE